MEDLNEIRDIMRPDVAQMFPGVSEDTVTRLTEIILGLALLDAEDGVEMDAKKFFGHVGAHINDGVKKGYKWATEVNDVFGSSLKELYNKAMAVDADPIPVFMTTYQVDRSIARKLVNTAKAAVEDTAGVPAPAAATA